MPREPSGQTISSDSQVKRSRDYHGHARSGSGADRCLAAHVVRLGCLQVPFAKFAVRPRGLQERRDDEDRRQDPWGEMPF